MEIFALLAIAGILLFVVGGLIAGQCSRTPQDNNKDYYNNR